VRAWMLTEQQVVDRLRVAGELYADPALLSWRDQPEFVAAYAWMRAQMLRRVVTPPARRWRAPWWAWVRPTPDLRDRAHCHTAPPGTALARVELEIPDAEALVSDFSAWGCVLNSDIVANSEAEWDAWQALPDPQGRRVAEASWERVFDPSRVAAPGWGVDEDDPLQVCFATLRWRDVRRLTRYRARPTREWSKAQDVNAHDERAR
jgi:Domain of unknown function (DUF3841)